MGSFSRTQSPVLAMPPSAAHQPTFGMPVFSHQPSPLTCPGSFASPAAARFQMQQQPLQSATSQSAGRKRSRDEAAINLDVEEAKLETIEPVKEPEDEWVYGPGMTLIKRSQAYISQADSQSGTWLEEKSAEEELRKNEEARAFKQQERPSFRSNKSQRLDMSSFSVSTANRSSPVRDINDTAIATPGLSVDSSSQPIIDNFTLHLGIGWSRISNDEHREAAARGWARYIENHFPISNVQIQLESRGLQSYLVEASEGFFLFAEDLQRGQFISRDLNQTFQNLKVSPPVFEGSEVMVVAGTPQPAPSQDVDMEMA
ncbi:hypothetical protein BKA67DRAFT_156158 [Truncatella angustata]|uniref:Uncharacterized protein n=1 Tax=Truncatella angustata TaxID=152316 RepID=A0A9P8UQM3_9PEZI|nr:uncharacterized protein BKA67DRAFT_156158 [Truncatella angustata]KAH6656439.1 hypothetical protein BKA67DRAFT_156158 [Truncatella angustata]